MRTWLVGILSLFAILMLMTTSCKKKEEAKQSNAPADFMVGGDKAKNDAAAPAADNAAAKKGDDELTKHDANTQKDLDFAEYYKENLGKLPKDERELVEEVMNGIEKAIREDMDADIHDIFVDNCKQFPGKCKDIIKGMFNLSLKDFSIACDRFAINLSENNDTEMCTAILAGTFDTQNKLLAEYKKNPASWPLVQKTVDALKAFTSVDDETISNVFQFYANDAAGTDVAVDFILLASDENDKESQDKAKAYWLESLEKDRSEEMVPIHDYFKDLGLELVTWSGKVKALEK